jgi:dihydroorotase
VLVDPDKPSRVTKEDTLYKCGWSPLEGFEFRSSVRATLVNGRLAWLDGQLTGAIEGQRLEFG